MWRWVILGMVVLMLMWLLVILRDCGSCGVVMGDEVRDGIVDDAVGTGDVEDGNGDGDVGDADDDLLDCGVVGNDKVNSEIFDEIRCFLSGDKFPERMKGKRGLKSNFRRLCKNYRLLETGVLMFKLRSCRFSSDEGISYNFDINFFS